MFRRSLLFLLVCLPVCAADLDKLAPADAGAAVIVNVKSLADSALFKKYVEMPFKDVLAKDEQLAKFFKAAEFDPLKDLASITVTAPLILNVNDAKACILLKGKFHVRFQIAALAAAKAQGDLVKISTKGARTYFTVPLSGQTIVATFVGFDTIALANSVEYLDDVIGGKKLEATPDAKFLRAAFANLDGRQTLHAGLGFSDDLKTQLAKNPGIKQYAEKTESLTATIHLTDTLDIALGANMTDADSAKALAQLLKQAVPLINLLTAQNEPAKPLGDHLVKNLKIGSEGKAVSVKVQFTETQLLRSIPGGDERLQQAAEAEQARAVATHVATGKEAVRAQKFAEADRAFAEALRLDPTTGEVRAALLASLRAGTGPERKWAAEKLTRPLLDAGKAALLAQRYQDAERECVEVLRLDPMNAEAIAQLAVLKTARTRVHLKAADAALRAGRFADAEREFTNARRNEPENADAAAGLKQVAAARAAAVAARLVAARTALAARKWAESDRNLAEAVQLDPQSPEAAGLRKQLLASRAAAHLEAAQAAVRANRFADAETEFAAALRFAPGDAAATEGLATLRARQRAALLTMLPGLIADLRAPDRKVRRRAAESLGQIGSDAREAIPALTRALKDDDLEVQAEARIALRKIAP